MNNNMSVKSPSRKRLLVSHYTFRGIHNNNNSSSSNRRNRLSMATFSTLLFLGLMAVMLAALVYVYSQFPVLQQIPTLNTQQQASPPPPSSLSSHKHHHPIHHHKHGHHHHNDDDDDKTAQTLQNLKARNHRNHQTGVSSLLTAGASADGGTGDVVTDNNNNNNNLAYNYYYYLYPQEKDKHPPRIYTCRCYPQVKYAFSQGRGFTMKKQHSSSSSSAHDDDDDDYTDAWIVWKTGTDIKVSALEHWQRPNHFPGERTMDRKGAMVAVLRQYAATQQQQQQVDLSFLPETYLLYNAADKERFLQRLLGGSDSDNVGNDSGMNAPWVLKRTRASRGRGVTMLGPQSAELINLREELIHGPVKPGHIVQSYIQREWTFQGHKCDLRVYVLVASVEPLIVYYHDGIVRTAVGLHKEDDFASSRAHLTNVSQNKMNRTLWEPVKTFDELKHELQMYTDQNDVDLEQELKVPPIVHVRNQIKQILGTVFAAFKSRISLKDWPVDNAFALMGADFVIDQDLKVWLLEMQLGPQLVGDNHAEKIAILQDVLTTTIDVVEEVFVKQAHHQPIMPLTKTGNFELVYSDESYQFQSSNQE